MSDMDTESPTPKFSHPPVQKAHEKLRELSADPEFRRMAQERERFLLEAEMDRKEAEARGQAHILRRLLRAKFGALPMFTEEQLRHARSEQLEHWADRVLFAETLDQVFSNH